MKRALLSLVLLALPAFAAGRNVTLIITGDNGGEVAPCGCKSNPTGGFAKRKTVLDGLKGENLLVLDAGNALYRNAGNASEADGPRAQLVFDMMKRLGTRAMVVGQRDLSAGVDSLKKLAAGSDVKLLSANLTRDGKPLFDSGVVLDVGGVKVGLVGVSAPGPIAPDANVTASAPLDAAKAAIKKLGKRDVTVVLAATSYADGMLLSRELKGLTDLVVQSGEFRGTVPPQRVDEASPLLLGSGQRGQALGKATITLGNGKGPLIDLTITAREREQLAYVDGQVKTLEERMAKATDKRARADFNGMLSDLKKRQAELNAAIAKTTPPGARTLDFKWLVLGQDITDDASWKSEVLKIEPTYAH
ncbi:MAG: hypothetical protein ACO1OB_31535 [Archangium sp.]